MLTKKIQNEFDILGVQIKSEEQITELIDELFQYVQENESSLGAKNSLFLLKLVSKLQVTKNLLAGE